jgi:hypothetical protein
VPVPRREGRAAAVVLAVGLVAASASAGCQTSTDEIAAARTAGAANCGRYAAPWGDDRARGTKTRPFRTAQRLVDALRRGETGCLRAGEYEAGGEDYVLTFPRAGTARRPIRISSARGELATLKGIVLVPEGSDHVALSDVRVVGDGSMNTIKVYAAATVLEDNDITNGSRGRSCVILGSDDVARASRTLVRRNFFHDCGDPANGNKDHAIYAAHVVDARIRGNLFVNPSGYAVHLYPDAQGAMVSNNVIDGGPDTVRGGIVIAGDDDYQPAGNVVRRNVIAFSADDNLKLEVGEGSDNAARDNCLWEAGDEPISNTGGTVTGNVVADPEFADREGGDYRLGAGSDCFEVLRKDPVLRLLRARGCARPDRCRLPVRP